MDWACIEAWWTTEINYICVWKVKIIKEGRDWNLYDKIVMD